MILFYCNLLNYLSVKSRQLIFCLVDSLFDSEIENLGEVFAADDALEIDSTVIYQEFFEKLLPYCS